MFSFPDYAIDLDIGTKEADSGVWKRKLTSIAASIWIAGIVDGRGPYPRVRHGDLCRVLDKQPETKS